MGGRMLVVIEFGSRYTPHGLDFGFFFFLPRTGKADEKADEEVRGK